MTPKILASGPETVPSPPGDEYPELEGIVTSDGKPVDSPYQEKLQRILTEPLYASWPGPGGGRVFSVLSNVGLFSDPKKPPLVPDVMLALDLPPDRDLQLKQNSAYFTWVVGKPPDVVLELVSDSRGEDGTTERSVYAAIGVPFYAIFDPMHHTSKRTLRILRLMGKSYREVAGNQFEGVGLGLSLWRGKYEEVDETWLRWCDTNGAVIPTGKERADELAQRAERLAHRAERMAARLRELGVDPDALEGT